MERFTTVCIWIAGGIEAIEEGLKNAPTLAARVPDFVTNELWGFAPIIILSIGALAWVINRFRRKQIPTLHKGIHYFRNRNFLRDRFGGLRKRLENTRHVDAILIVGGDYYYDNPNARDIKRLILPDPNSDSFKFFIESIPPQILTAEIIMKITEKAKEHNTLVKWSDEFLFHTMILADTDKDSGWVHIESALPYVNRDDRPSYTLEKKHCADAVSDAQKVFNKLWEALPLK